MKEQGRNFPLNLPAPVKGLISSSALMALPETAAVMLNNFVPYPDRLQIREGYASHVTGFTAVPHRLINYAGGSGTEKLFATTDAGVYDVSNVGTVGAAAIALTNGKVSSSIIATGANTYLMLVNGTDTLKQYDGTTWSSVATYSAGAVATTDFSYVELYRQRLFFAKKNSLTIFYLPVNSISGTATSYDLGALFRLGGYIVALGTWTVDGGTGPEDQLAIVTSKGEVAVMAGSDPGSASTWSLRGVYFIGKPLGLQPFFKSSGDLLFLSENGLYPLTAALQSASIERTRPISDNIRPLFNEAAKNYSANDGWQVISQPNIPLLIVNVPSTPLRQQFVMHYQSGAWATFTGWDAYAFARMGTSLYFSTADKVMRVTGVNDAGGNITATMLTSYTRLRHAKTKQIVLAKPYITTSGNFTYSLGVAADFKTVQEASQVVISGLGSTPIWGTSIWGTAVWAGTSETIQDWRTLSDEFSIHKSLYLQVTSLAGTVEFFGFDLLGIGGGNF